MFTRMIIFADLQYNDTLYSVPSVYAGQIIVMHPSTTIIVVTTVVMVCSAQRIPDEILEMSKHPNLSLRSMKPQRSRLLSLQSGAAYKPDCQNRTISCRDCDNFNQCAYIGGGYEYLTYYQCDESTPFCDKSTGQCVAQLSSYSECSFPARVRYFAFKCYEGEAFDGYYPTPYNCDRYYVCANQVAYVYNCPSGHVYNHAQGACVIPQDSRFTCEGAFSKCGSSRNTYVIYGDDPSVYAYCDTWGTPHISKCRPNYRINPQKPDQPCQPFCASIGRIANADDPRGYYECFGAPDDNSSSTLAEPVEQFCPKGMVFNDVTKRCGH